MKNIIFLTIGTMFGLILTKGEAVSWFRIQEMFLFQSFHMYAFIMAALAVAIASVAIIRKFNIRNIYGEKVQLAPIDYTHGTIIGGFIFGLGWAMIGACPGPMFALLGAGWWLSILIIIGALLGTLAYGAIADKLP